MATKPTPAPAPKPKAIPKRSHTKWRGNGGALVGFVKGQRLMFRQKKFASIFEGPSPHNAAPERAFAPSRRDIQELAKSHPEIVKAVEQEVLVQAIASVILGLEVTRG